MSKRSLTFLLAMSMLASVSCGSGAEPSDTTVQVSQATSAVETEPEEKLELPDNLNFGGYTFRILSRPDNRLKEVYSEELTGEALSDSVYKRNITIEDKLGIDFDVIISSSDWEFQSLSERLTARKQEVPSARENCVSVQ